MDRDEQRLLAELRNVADHPSRPPRLDDRIDVLRRALESDPPRRHTYAALEAIGLICLVIGVLLLAAAAIALVMALQPTPPPPFALESHPPPTFDWGGQLAMFILSGLSGMVGFWLVVNSQVIQWALDLQGNQDRHSFALHGIFHVLLAQREDGMHEHT